MNRIGPKTWLRQKAGGLLAVAARGPVAGNAAAILDQEKTARPTAATAHETTAAEQASMAGAAGTFTALLTQGAKQLQRAGTKLIRRHTEATAAAIAQQHQQATAHKRRDLEQHDHDKRSRQTRHDPVGVDHTYVAVALLVVARVVIGITEGGFWYQAQARSIDPSMSWLSLDRITAVMFAGFVPLAGILAATFAGTQIGRWYRAPANDTDKRRAQTAGMTASIVLLAITGVATFPLVAWRYTTPLALGRAPIPSWAMALIFTTAMLALSGLHAFAGEISSRHERRLDRDLRSSRTTDKNIDTALATANGRWAIAWHELAALLARILTQIEGHAFTAEDLIATSRGLHGHDAPATITASTSSSTIAANNGMDPLPGLHVATTAETTNTTSAAAADRFIPLPTLPDTVWHTATPHPDPRLELLTQAIDLLTTYAPPVTDPTNTAHRLTTRLHQLTIHLNQPFATPADTHHADTDTGRDTYTGGGQAA